MISKTDLGGNVLAVNMLRITGISVLELSREIAVEILSFQRVLLISLNNVKLRLLFKQR